MADENKRRPVPAGGDPTPDTLDRAEDSPVATDAGADEAAAHEDEDEGEHAHARALVAFDAYAANDLVSAPAAEIERLRIAGRVDPHPDAVAYVKGA